MINAIVYTSNTGTTKKYADLLRKKTGLPSLPLNEAISKISADGEIIYLGWIMAGKIKGLDEAAKHFTLAAVCGVGMGANGSQDLDVRKKNAIPSAVPVFTLQGGFDINKLHGMYKFMMKMMKKTAGKALQAKEDRTPEEDDMLDMLTNGGDRVSEEKLSEVLRWYGKVTR